MAKAPNKKQAKNKPGGSRYAALAILSALCLIVGAYLFFAPVSTVISPAVPVIPAPAPLVPLPQKNIPQIPVPIPAPTPAPAPAPVPQATQKTDVKTTGETPAPEEIKQHTITPPAGTALLAIIIDDMGTTMQEAKTLAGIGVPLTFSIIPGLSHYREVAEYAASSGIEVMIHIPMQSKGWPERRLEANGLLISMADKDITEHLEGYVRSLPRAIGANNHTGSEFTEHEDKMRVVLGQLKGKGLFFVDSVTSPKSVGERLAKELGVKTGRRNVFLDNEQAETYILGQLNQAVRLAKKTGSAIAICHPHPATLQTLVTALPGLKKQGITLVSASRLVR